MSPPPDAQLLGCNHIMCSPMLCFSILGQVMRKDRVLERDHGSYIKAERDVLTAVVHPYIVTLRYSFQVSQVV